MEPFIGEIRLVGFNFAPRGWARCEGQLLPIASNTALFSLLGTTYGGDGRTTFGLPDLRGRAAVGIGNGPGLSSKSWGQRGGSETHTLSANQMPAHGHGLSIATAAEGDANDPAGRYLAQTDARAYTATGPGTALASGTDSAGGGQAVNHQSPYLAMYYVIATQGIFPSRS